MANDTYGKCVCNSYKHDSICKHSIAVAIKEILSKAIFNVCSPVIVHLELASSNQAAVTQGKSAPKIRIRGTLHVQENHQVNTQL